jgi:cytochrome c peroxidase
MHVEDARAGRPDRPRAPDCRLALAFAIVALLVPLAATAVALSSVRAGQEPITPIAAPRDLDPAVVTLGHKLFHDVRLSAGGDLACSSCHDLAHGGDDGRAQGIGADGRPLEFNAPTVFNVALNFRFNWRGNFRELETQNEAALVDPQLMAATWDELLPRLRAVPEYARGFRAAYGRPIRREDVLDALAAFQRSLATPGARFDRFLAGDLDALTAEERQGYELFKSYGCISCHQGRNVGGNLFQRFGVFADPFAGRGAGSKGDLGRFAITGVEADRHVFRVPSLRNVAATAPYLHDGSAATLDEAVAIMGRAQLGIELPPRDIDLIVHFLGSLSGEYRGRPIAADGAGSP